MYYHQPAPPPGRPRPPQWAVRPAAMAWPRPPPHAPGGPPHFPPRPMMMTYAPHQPHYAHGPRFVRSPPLPPAAPADPDALWLQSFERQHLQGLETRLDERKPRDPPLRLVRGRLARMQTLLDQLQSVAAEVVELEKRLVAESEVQDLELTRLRAQRDRKRGICAGLKSEIEELASHTIHLPLGQLAEIKHFAQRVQLKKKARREAKQQRQAEKTIRRAIAMSSTEDESKRKQESESIVQKEAELEAMEQSAKQNALTQEKQLLAEREKAKKVLLLLDIKEQRRREQRIPMEEEERVLLQQTRDMALKCLEKRPKRPRSKIPANASQPQKAVQSETLETLVSPKESCNALMDPETINMETLISRRSHWDRFLVPTPNIPGASSIPPHFVPPPRTPNDSWAIYLHAEAV